MVPFFFHNSQHGQRVYMPHHHGVLSHPEKRLHAELSVMIGYPAAVMAFAFLGCLTYVFACMFWPVGLCVAIPTFRLGIWVVRLLPGWFVAVGFVIASRFVKIEPHA